MEKETYLQWFKKTYRFGWLAFILALFAIATVRSYYSEVPSDAIIPAAIGSIIFLIIFGITYYQYKKGDDTRFR